jgi:hypothetical protein
MSIVYPRSRGATRLEDRTQESGDRGLSDSLRTDIAIPAHSQHHGRTNHV